MFRHYFKLANTSHSALPPQEYTVTLTLQGLNSVRINNIPLHLAIGGNLLTSILLSLCA